MKQFEQPKFDISKNDVDEKHGSFTLRKLEKGFGVTIGNALRRVLLSSLPGLAVYSIKVEGADHEYTPLPGVMEDLTEIVLQIKKLVLRDESDDDNADYTLKLVSNNVVNDEGEKVVTANDILCPDMVSVVNKDLKICTLASKGRLEITMHARKGRGFVTAEENKSPSDPIGTIAVDSNFSPIEKVSLDIQSDTGRNADFETLVIDVYTDGSMSASDSLAWASKILVDHLQVFESLNDAVQSASVMAVSEEKPENKFTNMNLEELDLSVRSYNCLKRNGLKTIQDLCNMKESELMTVRNLGKKSYKEILDKLTAMGLSLQHDDIKK